MGPWVASKNNGEIMAVEYCFYCSKHIDLDTNVEHFLEDGYLLTGGIFGEGKCQTELDEDNWNDQAHYGDAVNKANKENPPVHKIDPMTGGDII